jgi:tetratricopeptide (TPR) repeat protein
MLIPFRLITTLCFAMFFFLGQFPLHAQDKKKKKNAKEEAGPLVSYKTTTDNPQAQAQFDQAFRDFENKQFDSAVQQYRAALQIDPSFLSALDHLALAFLHSGQIDSAAHFFRLSTATNPNGLMSHKELAGIYVKKKDFRNALLEYQAMIRINPEDPEGFIGQSKALFMLENFTGAIESGKKATQLIGKSKTANPDLGEAQYFMGMAFFYSDNKENAKLYLKKAKANGIPIPKDLQNDLNIK